MQKKWIIAIVIIVTIILIGGSIFLFTSKNKTDELNGLWDVDGNTKYEFDGKGQGKVIVANSKYEFTYTMKDNVVSVDFKNKESRDTEYEFKVSNDNLELKDLKQPSVNLKLKKVKE